MARATLISLLALSASIGVNAKIGYDGCQSMTTTNQNGYDYYMYYLPDTGEVCENPDCGGGRAPPKYDKPWCGAYTGTDSYVASYIDLPTPTPEPTPSSYPEETTSTSAADTSVPTYDAPVPTYEVPPVSSTTEAGYPTTQAPITTAPGTLTPVPSGTGTISHPGNNATVTTGLTPPSHTGGAAIMNAASGIMAAGLVAVAGVLAM
ncbi:hypothetical protein AJ80_03874 [Polytolypa hystricis UAMH7299]|uniref:Siderophore biosynthesis enzyme n=1 Tax=Polytolypa hystricis (strain UAMH7299) TaxID=1447883 RepID=A0A2B7YEN4_POLH7|nr:hypothetical protein AJ80_03874 [Polytolypa hystricis UAMH7299]